MLDPNCRIRAFGRTTLELEISKNLIKAGVWLSHRELSETVNVGEVQLIAKNFYSH